MKKILWFSFISVFIINGCQKEEEVLPTQTSQSCVTPPSIEKNLIGTWQSSNAKLEITFFADGTFSDKNNYLAPFFFPNFVYHKTWKVLNSGKNLELTLDGIDISTNQLGTNTRKLVFTYDIQTNECNTVAFTPNQTFTVSANISQRIINRVSNATTLTNEKCLLLSRNSYKFEYDKLGRVSKYTLKDDSFLTFTYNGASIEPSIIASQNLTRSLKDSQTDVNKPYWATTLFEYDNKNYLKSVSYNTVNPNYQEKATYEINAKGQITKFAITNSTYFFEYDSVGNIIKQIYQYPFSGKSYKNITTYKYDNKTNPLRFLGQGFLLHLCILRFTAPNYGVGILGVGLGINNPIEIYTEFEYSQSKQKLTLQYNYDEKQRPISYKYNALSMPDNVESASNYSLEYICSSLPVYE